MHYFAYCTYLDDAELKVYLPEARFVTKARVRDHQVRFHAAAERRDRGWCHLADVPGEAALGIVYEVNDGREEDQFDDFETFRVTATGDDGNEYDCYTYRLLRPGVPMRPPNYYWRHIPLGLRNHEFPADYIEKVEGTYAAALECPDADRPKPAAAPGKSAASR